MNNSKSLQASQMSMVLIVVLLLLLAILIGGSILAGTYLINESRQATHAQIDALVSSGDVTRLEQLKLYLAKNAAGISQTAALTNGLGKYDQNTIVATLSGYATKAGVSVTSFDFGSSTPSAAAGAAGAAANSAGTVKLALGSSVPYQKFIVFLRLIEQGLMPATVTDGLISADPLTPDAVSVNGLTIKVAE